PYRGRVRGLPTRRGDPPRRAVRRPERHGAGGGAWARDRAGRRRGGAAPGRPRRGACCAGRARVAPMIALSLAEIAAAVRAPAPAGARAVQVTGPVVVDSRQVGPGGLFAAIDGEHVDGHDYLQAAADAGAVAALVSRPVPDPPIPPCRCRACRPRSATWPARCSP